MSRLPVEVVKQLDLYISDPRIGGADDEDPLFTDRRGGLLTGDAVVKLFNRLEVRGGRRCQESAHQENALHGRKRTIEDPGRMKVHNDGLL